MFNIGFTELIVLGVIGLLVLGPEQLPEVARKMAKLFNELKRAKDEIMEPVEDLKAEASKMLERARESAAQKELDELLHRIDPSHSPTPGQATLQSEPLSEVGPSSPEVKSPQAESDKKNV